MERVAGFGSAVEAIEAGFQKREIETSAYQVAQEIDAGERVVVGVNRFALAEEEPYEPLRVDPAIEAAQTARLQTLRKRARRRGGRVGARRGPGGRRGDGQRPAADARGASGAGHRGRGLRHAASGVGPLPAFGSALRRSDLASLRTEDAPAPVRRLLTNGTTASGAY